MKNSQIYFDETNQKIRFTQTAPENINFNYNYIGKSNRIEFDLFIDLLWHKYEDDKIPLKDLKRIFQELREFCDYIKSEML